MRTYTTKHGTVATMNTAAIGQRNGREEPGRTLEGAVKPLSNEEKILMESFYGGETVVININVHFAVLKVAREEGRYVRVDRFSIWGNPFVVGKDGDRDACCEAYEQHYFPYKKSLHTQQQVLIGKPFGKVLGCHCHPERCHAHFLKRWVDEEAS